jgi:hypothetical protein
VGRAAAERECHERDRVSRLLVEDVVVRAVEDGPVVVVSAVLWSGAEEDGTGTSARDGVEAERLRSRAAAEEEVDIVGVGRVPPGLALHIHTTQHASKQGDETCIHSSDQKQSGA